MLPQLKKYDFCHPKVFFVFCVALIAGLFSTVVLAGGAAPAASLSSIATNVGSAIGSLVKVLQDVSTITGVGFIIAAFFKFHQHRQQPTQVGMSQGISLLLIGAGLAVFPMLLNVLTKGVFGMSAVKLGTGIAAISANS